MKEIEAGVLDAAKCVDIMELCWNFLKIENRRYADRRCCLGT